MLAAFFRIGSFKLMILALIAALMLAVAVGMAVAVKIFFLQKPPQYAHRMTRQSASIRTLLIAALAGLAFGGCGKLPPPPDVGKTLKTAGESAQRGVENAQEAVEVVKDPDRRRDAARKLKRDLQNPPRQFK
jgi:hypothetical protein